MTAGEALLPVGTAVRLVREVSTPFGTTVAAGTVGRVLRVATVAGAASSYQVAVLLRPSGTRAEQGKPTPEIIVSIGFSSLHVMSWLDLGVDADEVDVRAASQTREVVRVCWRCGKPHGLRYRVSSQMPMLSREYECPYCEARQEETAPYLGELSEIRRMGPRAAQQGDEADVR